MITIKYSLTHEEYQEIERERRGGIVRRGVRVIFGSLAGLVGLHHLASHLPFSLESVFGNLLIAFMGAFCVWGGLEMPGLALLLRSLSRPYAPRELRIEDGSITWSCGGKSRQFPWRPGRGFNENDKFFFLRPLETKANWRFPKERSRMCRS